MYQGFASPLQGCSKRGETKQQSADAPVTPAVLRHHLRVCSAFQMLCIGVCIAHAESMHVQSLLHSHDIFTLGLQLDILVVNCSVFNPTPSLAAAVINQFRLKPTVITYNLSGMGCSAGLLSIALVQELLQVLHLMHGGLLRLGKAV